MNFATIPCLNNLILLISLLPLRAWSHAFWQRLSRRTGITHWRREGLEVIESQWEPLYQELCLNTISFLRRATYSVNGKGGLVQLDNSSDRLERRDGQSCFRALSSLKVESTSNLLYFALQHYGICLLKISWIKPTNFTQTLSLLVEVY